MQAVTRRLQQELMAVMTSGEKGISAFPANDNILQWLGTIEGAEETPYAGLRFKLSLKFGSDYPFRPPAVRFETPCFHPNVSQAGDICLDILRNKWSPAYSVKTILVSIQSLLGDPNPSSPLNELAAQLWANKDEYARHVLQKYQDGAK